MAQVLYRFLLCFNSTSFVIVVYFIKMKYNLCALVELPLWVSHIVFALIPFACTGIGFWLIKGLSEDSIENEIAELESANNSFLPSYLGYFFVALSVEDNETMIFVYCIIFLFTFLSQTIYYNPLFLCFGYHFYNIVTSGKVKIFIISKKSLNSVEGLSFPKLRRINNFTFIDTEEETYT